MIRHACSRGHGSAPIRDLYQLRLEKHELAFLYLGYAGIIVRGQDRFLAFDVGRDCIHHDEIEMVETLDLQLYSHAHWDHWDLDITHRLFEKTGAPVVADPTVVNQMSETIPSDSLTAGIPGATLSINTVEITPIRGIHPVPITLFRVMCGRYSIFHGADSGYIPLSDYPVDVAFIPTGKPSPSCSPLNAMKMVHDLRPSVVVAMHGDPQQLQTFYQLIQQERPETNVFTPAPCELGRIHLGAFQMS